MPPYSARVGPLRAVGIDGACPGEHPPSRGRSARERFRTHSSQSVTPTPPAPFLLPILPGAGPCALVLAPLPHVQERRELPATSEPARGRPSGELACANKLYVVVFVTGVMISPSVIRVAALVPDPIQQIKDGGATDEMNELVFSPRYQCCCHLASLTQCALCQ